jgi:hypothetical protein
MSMRVANQSVAVLGGSGYMKDYAVERHLRDSRITTIYEGTTQLQIVAGVRGVMAGSTGAVVNELLDRSWPEEISPLVEQVRQGLTLLEEAVAFVKEEGGGSYMDLYGRKLVDIGCALIIAALFCDQAAARPQKVEVTRYWLNTRMAEIRRDHALITSGDRAVLSRFDDLALPVAAHD